MTAKKTQFIEQISDYRIRTTMFAVKNLGMTFNPKVTKANTAAQVHDYMAKTEEELEGMMRVARAEMKREQAIYRQRSPFAQIEKIAVEVLGLATLKERGKESLDFHDFKVTALEAALEAAYDAGYQRGLDR